MKTAIIVLVTVIASVTDAKVRCGLSDRARNNAKCSYFIEKSKGLTTEQFQALNPHIDCKDPNTVVKDNTEVCLYGQSKFDDGAAEDEMLTDFLKTANPIVNKRRSGSYSEIYNSLMDIANKLKTARRKRDTAAKERAELELIANFSDPSRINFVRDVTKASPKFKAMEEEVEKGRDVMCAQLAKEKGSTKTVYHQCICDDKQPFIYCQSLLMKHEVDKSNYRGIVPTHPTLPPEPKRFKRALKCAVDDESKPKKGGLPNFIKYGCPDMDCLSTLTYTAECCMPIPKVPILSICIEGSSGLPNPVTMIANGGRLDEKMYLENKFGAKFGVCLTDFADILSWLGIERCLASIAVEYYYWKSSLALTPQIALIIVKASVTAKTQFRSPFKNGINNEGIKVNSTYSGDICKADKHKCEDYCSPRLAEFAFSYSVDVWWWGWRTVSSNDLATTFTKPQGCA